MSVATRITLAAAAAAVCAVPLSGRAQPDAGFTADALAAIPSANWATNGGDLYNRRYSSLTQINRGNVANLKAVWRARLNGSGIGPQYSGEAEPLVHVITSYSIHYTKLYE